MNKDDVNYRNLKFGELFISCLHCKNSYFDKEFDLRCKMLLDNVLPYYFCDLIEIDNSGESIVN